jgi:microcystin-dependent protein
LALNFPSDTSNPYVDPISGVKYIYNTAVGAWESAIQPPTIVSNSEPTLSIEGFLWWDDTNSSLKVYDDSQWKEVAPNISTQVAVSDTPPGGAGNGSLWFDTESGRIYVYYIDADSSQWVVASPLEPAIAGNVVSSTTAPASSESIEGDLWYNTTTGELYVFTSSVWVVTQNAVSGVTTVTAGTNTSVTGTAADPVVNVPNATTSVAGAIQIADQSTVNAGSSTTTAITPSGLASGISNYLPDATETSKGVMEIATSTEVATGTDNTRAITPAGFAGAINSLGISNPTGSIITFAGSTAPAGYLECDGSAVDRTTYATLFGVIGETFGAGDTTTTFNVPDLRGEFIRGWDDGRGIDSGRAFASTQNSQNLAHSHNVTDPGHQHTATLSDDTAAATVGASTVGGAPSAATTDNTTTNITIDNAGGSEARPRNIALLYCIKF